jgi:heterodisulfide reductase subunit B2
MKIGYFPGCSLMGTSKEFDISLREVMKVLEIELIEIQDWSCCGASSAHVTSKLLAASLPARNLILAQKQGLDQILAPCAACYSRLISSQHELKNDSSLKNKVERVLEEKYEEKVRVVNIVEFLQQLGPEIIKKAKKVDLKGMNVATYYGCLLVRPHEITKFDDVEDPQLMDSLVSAKGANVIDWNFKTECCGGGHSISHKNIVTILSKKILDDAKQHGANVVAVACPMCHSNLDMRQIEIKKQGAYENIPILYLTEIIGLSLGVARDKLGLNLHFINVPETICQGAN